MTQPEEAKGVLLEARNLEKSFGGVRAVQGTSIDLAAGSVAGLVGPNGAGKTTIFNLLTGFIAPDAGSVRFKDQELVGLVPQSIAVLGVGRTFQDLRLFERMSVLENVLIYSTERFDRLTDVLIPRRSVRRKHQRALSRARESLEHVGLGKKASVRAADLS
ncbi:MAG: ATP-binding cassette domain-containing protein, partial [bacterium]